MSLNLADSSLVHVMSSQCVPGVAGNIYYQGAVEIRNLLIPTSVTSAPSIRRSPQPTSPSPYLEMFEPKKREGDSFRDIIDELNFQSGSIDKTEAEPLVEKLDKVELTLRDSLVHSEVSNFLADTENSG